MRPYIDKTILDLCGGTGAWSNPYKDAGYDVKVITLPDHDIRTLPKPDGNIYGILAAPPCTHFAGVGNRWWAEKDIDGRTLQGISIMDACMRIISISRPLFWCLENPKGRMSKYLGAPVMPFHPCDYGDPYRKLTCLWGNFNKPALQKATPIPAKSNENAIDRYIQDVKGLSLTTANRAELRSMTPPGFAKAFFEANK
ncbi:hypothetical protein LCGC14_2576000 [marine sediment metagenome]|uniref:DNA (cytosine-5-)-methyltransferase n=1 Tax=marine sediment metagenome TaxID=412755 RepID=A0A0F9CS11_9ZZZZ